MKEDIQKAVEVLRQGGVILYPTDTVWGLGCDAANEAAVEKIYTLKKRTDQLAMLVLMSPIDMMARFINNAPSVAWDLIEMTEEPLTLIFDQVSQMAPNLTAPDGSVGVRLVQHEFCSKLIQSFRKPLVSTSANLSGKAFPQSLSEISKDILAGVDWVAPAKYATKMTGKPSSIIKLSSNGTIKIIRE